MIRSGWKGLHPSPVHLIYMVAFLMIGSFTASAQQVECSKTVDDNNPPSGADIIYTIDFGCSSLTTDCEGAVMVDNLPAGLEFQSSAPVIIQTSAGPTAVPGVYDAGAHSITWDFTTLPEGGLPDGVSGTITVNVHVPEGSIADGTTFTNDLNLTSNNAGSASSAVDVVVNSSVDWEVTKTVTSGPIFHDMPVTYQVEICPLSTMGNVNLTGATITDLLPPGADFVSATNGGAWDNNDPGEVTWNLGDLNVADGCTTVEVVVTYPAADMVNNNTGLATSIPKLNTANLDAGSVNGPVALAGTVDDPLLPPSFDLGISKVNHDLGILPINEINHFTLGVSNNSTVAVDDFLVFDDLPDQFDLTGVELINFSPAMMAILEIRVQLNGGGAFVVWQPGVMPGMNPSFDAATIPGYNPPADYVSAIEFDFGNVPVNFSGDINLLVTPAWDGTGAMVDNAGNPVAFHTQYENCVDLTATNPLDLSTLGPEMSCDHMCYVDRVARVNVDNQDVTSNNMTPGGSPTAGNPYLVGSEVTYSVHLENDGSDDVDPNNLTGATALDVLSNPVGANLLPVGVTYVPNSWVIAADNTGLGFDNSGANPVFEEIPNYNGTGRTLLRWNYTGDFDPGDFVDVSFEVEIDAATAPGTDLTNNFCVSSGSDFICEQQDCGNTNTTGLADYFDAASAFTESCCSANTITVADSLSVPAPQKDVVSSGPYAPTGTDPVALGLATDTVEYEITIANDVTANVVLPNPIALDLLPEQLDFVAGSLVLVSGSNTTGLALADDGSNPTLEVVPDFMPGQTLVRLRFTGDFPIESEIKYRYKALIRPGAGGTATNKLWLDCDDQNVDCMTGEMDVNDLDGDGDTNELICVDEAPPVAILSLASLAAKKFVKGPNDTAFLELPDIASTNLDDSVSWKMQIINAGNQPLNNVVVYDIFPYVGDMGVKLNAGPRETQWRPFLVEPINAPAGVVVYYSLSRNPCRPEIGTQIDVTGTCTDDWNTTPPADLSTVESVKFEIDHTMAPAESFEFFIEMWSPSDPLSVKSRSIAWNSLARNADEVPDQEPNKVGIRLDYFDLALQKTLAPGQTPAVAPGGDVTFRINVINQGGFPARNTLITDYVPAGLTFDPISNPTWNGAMGDPAPTFLLTDLLQPGDTGFVDIVLAVDPAAAVGDTFSNGAEIASSEMEDGTPADDLDSTEDNDPNNDGPVEDNEIDGANGDEDDHDTETVGVTDCTLNITNVSVGPCADNGMGASLVPVTVEVTWTNAPAGQDIEVTLGGTTSIIDVQGGATSPATITIDAFADNTTGNPIAAGFQDGICIDFDGDTYDAPVPCGSDCFYDMGVVVTCDGLGTTDSNDDKFIVSLNPQGSGLGGTYTISGDADLAMVPYGTDITAGIFDISGGDISLTVTDDNDANCEYSFSVTAPAPCSAPETDFGDLPASFATQIADNGAVHTIVPGLYLGMCVDPDIDGAPDAMAGTTGAGGDDLDATFAFAATGACTGNDDEDGITFVAPMIPGESSCIQVKANSNAGAVLNAWIDFNGDGDFAGDADEQVVFTAIGAAPLGTPTTEGAVSAGVSTQKYYFNVPATATFAGGETHSRFRLSSAGGLSYDGAAPDGEVEDYWLPLAKVGNLVFDDDNYNGAQDAGEAGINGVQVDLTFAGDDGMLGTADDLVYITTTANVNGEDGVYNFCGLISGDYKITPTPPANQELAPENNQGGNDVIDSDGMEATFSVPDLTATNLPTGENGNSDNPGGTNGFPDERDNLTFDFGYAPFDFGDLPDTYETTDANNGPSHAITADLMLGSGVDAEPDGQPEPMAGMMVAGDDNTAGYASEGAPGDDEDGIVFISPLIPDGRACLQVTAVNNTGAAAKLQGWIDFNGNGTFDANEELSSVDFAAGGATIPDGGVTGQKYYFDVPIDATFDGGMAFSRFRLSENGGLASGGKAGIGEVEDYKTTLAKVGSYVWNDLNFDGLQDEDASFAIEGAVLQLMWAGPDGTMSTADDVTYTTSTAADGTYSFCGLIAGDYEISAPIPPPMFAAITSVDMGMDDEIDSDDHTGVPFTIADVEMMLTGENSPTGDSPGTINGFPDNQDDLSYDFGFFMPAFLGNYVWEDLNYNGIQDPGEPGIKGAEVTLYDCTGGVKGAALLTIVTDGTGFYQFSGLVMGDYCVQVNTATADDPGAASFETTVQDDADATDATDSDVDATGCSPSVHLAPGEENYTLDAGFFKRAKWGDVVWEDENGNGIQDAGEPGIEGVDVTLTGTDGQGNPIAPITVQTDATGMYMFGDLLPGDYEATFGQPMGYTPTANDDPSSFGDDTSDSDADPANGLMTPTLSLVSGDTIPDVDAGFYILGKIGDVVWDDVNGNGLQDAGEPGIEGADVTLTGTDGLGNPIAPVTIQTGPSGMYMFGDLVPGDYKVTFTEPTGYETTFVDDPTGFGDDKTDSDASPINGMSPITTLSSGDTIPDIDAGYYVPGKIGDVVWDDLNGNGVQDAGEPGIEGATVALTGTDGAGNTVTLTTLTDATGMYMFGDLAPGDYKVTFTQPTGYEPTALDDPSANGDDTNDSDADPANMLMTPMVTIESGDTIPDLDAGFYILGKIGDVVWDDLNGNGIQDPGEPGIEGANVTLTGTDGLGNPTAPITLQTDANGMYMFGDLVPGDYEVTFGQPTGYVPTANDDPSSFGDDTNDSDADIANGLMSPITTLASGDTIPDIDAGFYILGKLGDVVWEDVNGNGVQDAGEPGIGNVDATLTGTDGLGNPIAPITLQTDANGMYMFGDLVPGIYEVTFAQPNGFVPTANDDPSNNGDDSSDSDADPTNNLMTPPTTLISGDTIPTLDAGFLVLGKIGDYVWQDYSADGVQDNNEDPLEGVEVTLTGTDGLGNPVTANATTDASGMYMFGDLWPGDYEVTFTQPDDMVPTEYDAADGDQPNDNDADPANGLTTPTVTIESRDTIPSLDAGFYGEDYGDAPDSFVTTEGNDGPRHVIQPDKYLGAGVDAERDAAPEAKAGSDGTGGDDNTASAYSKGTVAGSDEDGIAFVTPLIPGHEACVEVTATNATGDAYLTGWIDFDGDGTFAAGEQLLFDVGGTATADAPVSNGTSTQQYCFEVPADATFDGGETHTRFRLSCETGVAATGKVVGGEVEDYWLSVAKVGNLVWRDYEYGGDQDEPSYDGFNGVDVQLVWAGEDATPGTADDRTYTTTTAAIAGEDGKYCFYGLLPGEYTLQIPDVPDGFEPTLADNTGNDVDDSDGTSVGFTIADPIDLPTGENSLGDDPTGDNYPDNQTDLTFDFGFIAFDYGDLPAGFPTVDADNGANHSIVPGMFLGKAVDSETDGAPQDEAGNDGTGGDDNTASAFVEGTLVGTSDEDGIEFLTPMVPGYEACIKVTHSLAAGNAVLNAWIDFNGDGDFTGDANEQINFTKIDGTPTGGTTDGTLPAGTMVMQEFCFDVPADATFDGGETHLRFRMSEAGGLTPDGFAVGGEVEDYWMPFTKVGNYVWYDKSYDGLQDEGSEDAFNGAVINLTWTGEDDTFGTADDRVYTTTSANIDGEDGKYCFLGLTGGEEYQLAIEIPTSYDSTKETATGNDDDDSNSQAVTFTIADAQNLPTGENGTGDNPGSAGGGYPDNQDDLTFDFGIVAFDFGDNPDGFATTDANNGAYHVIHKGMYLGTCVDAELDGAPAPQAGFDELDGDDLTGSNYVEGTSTTGDEDGVKFLTPMIPGEEACIEVASNIDNGTGKLNLWIDFNGDGDFAGDANEQISFTKIDGAPIAATTDGDMPNGTATQEFCFEVPADAVFDGGETHVRARLSPLGGLPSDGEAIGGEVEDYYVPLAKVGSIFWADFNINGIQDEPEIAGLDGFTVTLTAPGNDGQLGTADDRTYETTTATVNGPTGASEPGIYQFCGLLEGDYQIEFGIDPDAMTDSDLGDDDKDSDGQIVTFSVGHLADDQPLGEAGMGDDLIGSNFPDSHANLSIDGGIKPFDYGDLPASFANTLFADDGARHIVLASAYLGMCADVDLDGLPDTNAGELNPTGDNNDPGLRTVGNCMEPGNDEEGIKFLTPMLPGEEACFEVKHTSLNADAFLNAWIDYNGDGTFAANGSEQIEWTKINGVDLAAPTVEGLLPQGADMVQEICFHVPETATFEGGETHLRFRMSTAGGLGLTGMALDGEVEDYWLPFAKVGNYAWDDHDLEGDQSEDPAAYAINGQPIQLVYAGPDGTLGNNDDIIYETTTANLDGTDGKYLFCGLTEGTYKVQYTEYPDGMISAIPDHTGDDETDSDGTSQTFSISGYPFNLPTGENSTGDTPNGVNNYPDDQDDWTVDFAFVQEPKILAALNISGIDFASSGTCGNFNATFDICIKNPELVPLANPQAQLDFASANAFGSAFIGLVGAPQIISSTAASNPALNTAFDGAANAQLFDGNSGLLEQGQQICLRFTIEVAPEAAGAPLQPKMQAMVSGGAVNNSGVPIPDLLNGLSQFIATDMSDGGSDPMASNTGAPGNTGGSDDATPLTDCWNQPMPACNDNVQVSLDENGQATITSTMILEGENEACTEEAYPLGGYYQTMLLSPLGAPLGNTVDCSDVGQTIIVKVTNVVSCNSCWGSVSVEDKLGPTLECPPAIQVACDEELNAATPIAYEPCGTSNVIVNLTDETTLDDDMCDDGLVVITRTWIAFDEQGNESEPCTQTIEITRPDVDFPEDIIWTCGQYAAYPNIVEATALHPYITDTDVSTHFIDVNLDENCDDDDGSLPYPAPDNTKDRADINSTNLANGGNGCPGDAVPNNGLDDADVLELTGSGIPGGTEGQYCMRQVTHSDETLEDCGTGFKIVRTWTVLDWCTGAVITSNNAGEDNVQVIKVIDREAPVVAMAPFTVDANIPAEHPQPCKSTGYLPAPTVSDNCSNWTVRIYTPAGEADYVNGNDGSQGGFIPSPGLELGSHIVTYKVTDECGNRSELQVTVTVADNIVPVTVCDEITDVNLTTGASTEVFAETFDDGSYDNCCLDRFEVARMEDPCDDGHDDLVFGPSINFCCADAGQTVTVVFRAVDCFDNHNECMVQVNVSDKQAPLLVSCPGSQRVTCDWYAENLETQLANADAGQQQCDVLAQYFGEAEYFDNCGQNVDCSVDIDLDQCLEGRLRRTWTATDGAGNANSAQNCTQTIWVDHVSDWSVEFPADLLAECGTDEPDFGVPVIFKESCELVAVSYEDELFNDVPDACYKILRTWTVINWCVVGGDIDQEVEEVSEADLWLQGVTNLNDRDINNDGHFSTAPGDRSYRTFRDSWNNTPGRLHKPTAALNPTGNQNHNTNISNPDTDVDSDPWDGYITYQQTIKVNDTVDPVFTDGCQIGDVCIGDNTCSATVTLPTPGIDECSSNVDLSAEIRIGGTWLSGFGSYLNVAPGTYEVRYTAQDNCNNQTACATTVSVVDCKKPTPYCKDGIVVELMVPVNAGDEAMVDVWATDLNDASFDNCPGDLKFSFSADVDDNGITFNCDDLGQNEVELWVTDAAGNQDFCITSVVVQANMGQCPGDDPQVAMGGAIATEANEGVQEVSVQLSGAEQMTMMTDIDGAFGFNVSQGGDYTITPAKDDDPLNGVTTYDLVLISKHVLGVELLDSPYKLIAADANNSQSVTTFDIVQIRKLILYVDEAFQSNTSWRFVEKGYAFPNAINPWEEIFPEVSNYNNVEQAVLDADFVAVKIGDVNGSARVNFADTGEDRGAVGSLVFNVEDQHLEAGETYTVDFTAKDFEVQGYQFTLNFDQSEVEFVEVKAAVAGAENFGYKLLDKGVLTASWNGNDVKLTGEQVIFSLVFKALNGLELSDAIQVNSRFTLAEAYRADGSLLDVGLAFNGNLLTAGFELYQNTPNPFDKGTVIGFILPEASTATLTISDVSGKILRIKEGDFAKGYNEFRLERSEIKATGLLYYQLDTDTDSATRKMVVFD